MTTNEDRAREWVEDHSEEEVNPFNIASLTRLIIEAEERGRAEEREACAQIAESITAHTEDERAMRYDIAVHIRRTSTPAAKPALLNPNACDECLGMGTVDVRRIFRCTKCEGTGLAGMALSLALADKRRYEAAQRHAARGDHDSEGVCSECGDTFSPVRCTEHHGSVKALRERLAQLEAVVVAARDVERADIALRRSHPSSGIGARLELEATRAYRIDKLRDALDALDAGKGDRP